MILSHFHFDHISGLDHLLKKINVDTIIIPYFNPFERLLLSFTNPNLIRLYSDFLVDPIDYLLERKVNNIVILNGKKYSEPIFNERGMENFDEKEKRKFNIDDLENNEELSNNFFENEIDWKEDNRKKNVYMKNHSRSLIVSNNWIFRFFNYKVTYIKMKLFIKELNKHKIKYDGSKKSLGNIINNKNTRDKFRDSYKKLHKNINDTSIILYHGPINFKNLTYKYNLKNCDYVDSKNLCRLCCIKYPQFGQFLTGDINLNTNYKDITNHFNKYLKEIILTSIPHHGSDRNWKSDILSDLPNCYNYIVSSGFKNRHHLPAYRPIYSVKNNGKYCCWNNENNEITIDGIVIW